MGKFFSRFISFFFFFPHRGREEYLWGRDLDKDTNIVWWGSPAVEIEFVRKKKKTRKTKKGQANSNFFSNLPLNDIDSNEDFFFVWKMGKEKPAI